MDPRSHRERHHRSLQRICSGRPGLRLLLPAALRSGGAAGVGNPPRDARELQRHGGRGHHPDEVAVTEPLWRDLTHQQVWDQVHAGPGPYVSDSAATAWNNAQSALQQIDGDLDAAIRKAAGWTGAAADATRSGLTPLGGWA